MSRLRPFRAGNDVHPEVFARRSPLQMDHVAERLDEFLRRELGQIDLNEICIAEVFCAVVEANAHGFGEQMDRLRIASRLLGQIETFQQIQHLDDRHSSGTRRRHPDDFITAVCSTKGRTNLRLVVREIVERHDSTAGLQTRNQLLRHFAFVESVGAFGGDLLECPGEIRQLHRLAGFIERFARFAIDTAKLRILLHSPRLALQRPGQHFVNDESIAR